MEEGGLKRSGGVCELQIAVAPNRTPLTMTNEEFVTEIRELNE